MTRYQRRHGEAASVHHDRATRAARRAAAWVGVAALALWAPGAAAQTCDGLAVTNMTFDAYSPFGAGVSAAFTITYTCAAGASPAVAIEDRPRPRTLRMAGSTLQFDLYQDAGHSTVWLASPAVPVPESGSTTVYGFLWPQDAAEGTYSGDYTVELFSGTPPRRTGRVTVAIQAVVPSVCEISSGTLAFGGYDPLGAHAAAPRDAQGSIQLRCTRDTAYTVGLGPGSHAAGAVRQMANGTERLAYELYTSAARTTVWSTTTRVGNTARSTAWTPLPVHGRIPPGQGVMAGPYDDVVQATIDF